MNEEKQLVIQEKTPIICHECGKQYVNKRTGFYDAKKDGWKGFSKNVKLDGQYVHLGQCPDHMEQ